MRTLFFILIGSFILITVTGCPDHGHDHDKNESHSENHSSQHKDAID
jgi:hypothetical protein